MGQVPTTDTNRDISLIKDYLLRSEDDNGWLYSITELGLKYAREVNGKTIPLTASRISQILTKHGVPRKRIKKPSK